MRAIAANRLARTHYHGPWHIAYKVSGVLCSDGRRRTAWIAGEPDTYFSQPAFIRAHGKTIRGSLTGIETNGERDTAFHAYTYLKNGHVLPEWVYTSVTYSWINPMEAEQEITRVTPDGRYAYKVCTEGIGSPRLWIVDTQDNYKELAQAWAKPESLDRAIARAVDVCNLLNSGLSVETALSGWDSWQ